MRHRRPLTFALALLLLSLQLLPPASAHDLGGHAQAPAPAAQATVKAAGAPAWVARSNQNAQVLLNVLARFGPEGASFFGVEGFDEQTSDLSRENQERGKQATLDAIKELQGRLGSERDPAVRQDLEILINSAEQNVRGTDLSEKYAVPYFDLSQLVFRGLSTLLDDRVPEARRRAALVRLRRYAGLETGTRPIAEVAIERTREGLKNSKLAPPAKIEVEKNLANSNFFINGVGQLFEKYRIEGYQEPYAKLKEQLAAHDDFVRKEVLPKARTDFRLPPELYAYSLEQFGVDIPPARLAEMAHAAFTDIQKQMQAVAAVVAKQRGFKSADYRDVIRELKKEQFVGEAILPHYRKRLAEIEEIVRRERLVTLPARPAVIRFASEAEGAGTPAPHVSLPRLIGNTGEAAEFVLPLVVPTGAGANQMQRFDDFTFEAASWTLTAHEARPGHEMQFASVIERGVSTTRAVFAFNSTNVEGWGLYAEAILLPHMPPEGQLISLQHRLMRAARAFLDPELQAGKVTPEQAFAVLKNDVVLSDAMANQEVERYTFRSPGQATSYFYGYTRLMELRAEVQKAAGAKFDQQKFHDFVLAQGLLPPGLMRKAVHEEFLGHKRG